MQQIAEHLFQDVHSIAVEEYNDPAVQEHYKEDPVISLEFYQILQDEGKTIVEDFEHVEGAKISIQYTKDWIIEIVKTISKG